jgi:uncharacterized protein YhdP
MESFRGPKSPWKFDKEKASGSISINIDKGVILEAQPGAMGRTVWFAITSITSE